MTTPLIPPGVEFSASNKGGDYLAKLQALSAAVDLSFSAYNQQLGEASTAEQIRQATDALRLQTVALVEQAAIYVQQAYAAIGAAGDTATYAVQLQNTRTIAGKPFNGTQNVELSAADITGLVASLAEIELFALAGMTR
jgi:hypothetical protein